MGIRTMIAQDRDDIVSMLHNIRVQGIFKKEEVECALELVDIYLKQKGQKDYEFYVDLEENLLLGYICFGKTPLTDAVYDIYWVAVNVNAQRKGVGRKLMEFAEKIINERGGRKIIIETSSLPLYEFTRLFYNSLNYKEVSRIKDFYSIGDDRILYEKVL